MAEAWADVVMVDVVFVCLMLSSDWNAAKHAGRENNAGEETGERVSLNDGRGRQRA